MLGYIFVQSVHCIIINIYSVYSIPYFGVGLFNFIQGCMIPFGEVTIKYVCMYVY